MKELLHYFTPFEWIKIIGGAIVLLPVFWAGMSLMIILGG
jgi:hypothetical protein